MLGILKEKKWRHVKADKDLLLLFHFVKIALSFVKRALFLNASPFLPIYQLGLVSP